MDKNPGRQCKLFQFLKTRNPEKAHSNCSKVAAEHEGRGFFATLNIAPLASKRQAKTYGVPNKRMRGMIQ